ncbi:MULTISPECIES: hypothetical protein [Paenibacillus]|uniref:hypothetical protein n=1 Tax=Paenibacillus TaxID=44249 RepID=UPI002FE1E599
MKSSTFLFGVILGAVATGLASRRKGGWMSMLSEAGSMIKLPAMNDGKQHDKSSHAASNSGSEKNGADPTAQVFPSSVSSTNSGHSKEYSLKQISDFIKGDADVRREVEAILKETRTAVPGF